MRPMRSSLLASMYWRSASITALSWTCTSRMRPGTGPKLPNTTSCINVHSIDTGASAIYGTATRSDGVRVSPASTGSSTPFGNAIEVMRIFCASANGTEIDHELLVQTNVSARVLGFAGCATADPQANRCGIGAAHIEEGK